MPNLLTLRTETVTINGLTFNSDAATGTVIVSGTATSDTLYAIANYDDINVPSNSRFVLTGCPVNGHNHYGIVARDAQDNDDLTDFGYGVNGEIPDIGQTSAGEIGIFVENGTVLTNVVFIPFLGLANGGVHDNLPGLYKSDVHAIINERFVVLTAAEYSALTTKDPDTYYFIKET